MELNINSPSYYTRQYGVIDEKKGLIINNVLASVKAIHSRAKIDYAEFSKDIMQYCEQAGIVL
ncbi:MAG: hypothetical protein J1F42_09615 [Lachnospiraceae bacterium]|nr:hypothetical protein [Lachnospiraceae bacterium]